MAAGAGGVRHDAPSRGGAPCGEDGFDPHGAGEGVERRDGEVPRGVDPLGLGAHGVSRGSSPAAAALRAVVRADAARAGVPAGAGGASDAVGALERGGASGERVLQAARDGGGPGASMYATAKAAVLCHTRAMAKELGPKGIRVNALTPGMINTSFHDRFTKPEARQNLHNTAPLRREGEAYEVADLVCYLASDESSYITGTGIDINGGTLFS